MPKQTSLYVIHKLELTAPEADVRRVARLLQVSETPRAALQQMCTDELGAKAGVEVSHAVVTHANSHDKALGALRAAMARHPKHVSKDDETETTDGCIKAATMMLDRIAQDKP